jgi:large subunit ribosomal protein L2
MFNIKVLKSPVLKKYVSGSKNTAGKNNSGKITIRHRGGGHKRKNRSVLFNRSSDSKGILMNIEYDPNRSSFLGVIYNFLNSKFFYVLLPKGSKIGDIFKSGSIADNKLGHSVALKKIPIGSFIHNISLKHNKGGVLIRSAGTKAVIIEKDVKFSRVKLNSGEHRLVPNQCYATLGIVSNENFFLKSINKAGRSRWLNKRPKVRGVAMNPIDHPHGGGEGKTSGGKIKVTPWGKPTLGVSTKKFKNPLIISNNN